MKATLDSTGAVLRLDFDSLEALRAFAADWQRKEGCLVRLAEPLKLWTELTVELRQQGALRAAVEARVMQVFGGGPGGYATALQATDSRPLESFARQPADVAEGAGGGASQPAAGAGGAALPGDGGGGSARPHTGSPSGAGDPRPAATAGQTPPAAGGGEMLGASPAFRIRQMNVPQKMLLAAKATRGERQILLRDSSPQVLMGLLANPRLEDKEVLALARSTSASSGVLKRIAEDRRWSGGYEVRLALVKNPQTPTPLALKLLATLRERDLRVLAKGSMVREAIRAAALRKVVKR